MTEAAILDGQFVKNCNTSCKEFYDTILVQIHSEVLENCHFHVFAILVTAADGHVGLSHQFVRIPFADHFD